MPVGFFVHIHERAARSAERRMDAPGRRGRFAVLPAKSNDDARAEGASDGIVSLYISMRGEISVKPSHLEGLLCIIDVW